MVLVLFIMVYAMGPMWIFKVYVVPYWVSIALASWNFVFIFHLHYSDFYLPFICTQVFVVWLDAVTYLHHHGHNEKVPWYRGQVSCLLVSGAFENCVDSECWNWIALANYNVQNGRCIYNLLWDGMVYFRNGATQGEASRLSIEIMAGLTKCTMISVLMLSIICFLKYLIIIWWKRWVVVSSF